MFPQFGATAESISKASSLVLRIGTDAHLYDDPDDVNIAPLLDSRFDSEKVEALKRLLALIAQGADVSHFYPQVVKNVASHSLEVKKLVYLYLLHYAEKRQNEALLSVNCFQKDLSDTNPLVRAWALRAMAGIRLHVVAPLVLVAVGKCARDPSAYVRKCAAHALPKLCNLLPEENVVALVEIVDILLGDNSPGVIGASAAAFQSVCSSNLLLIKKHFKRLCEILPDVDEWGQIALIEILLRYVVARHGLDKESIMFTSDATLVSQTIKDLVANHQSNLVGDLKMNTLMYRCYAGEREFLSRDDHISGDRNNLDFPVTTFSGNDDVKLLLQCTSPLLWSHNSAVVLAATAVHWIMSTKKEVERIVKPLLFLLRSSKFSKYVNCTLREGEPRGTFTISITKGIHAAYDAVCFLYTSTLAVGLKIQILCNVLIFAKAAPSFFAPYFEDFFVCGSDSYQIRALKLEILSIIATESTMPIILDEFQEYMKDPNRKFVADTIAAIGLCAQRMCDIASSCLEGLLALLSQESSITTSVHIDGEADVLVQTILSIKGIIKQDPISHEKVIIRLVRTLDKVKEPAARALIIWIAGEYNSIGQNIPKIMPSVLRYLAWSFTSEEVGTKLQILNTAAKVILSRQGEDISTFRKMFSYIIELARYDLNYDLRDRARVLLKLVPSQEDVSCLLKNESVSRDLVETMFLGQRHSKITSTRNIQIYLPGSLSQVVLHAAPGYVCLPKPCSMVDSDLHFQPKLGKNDNFGTDDPDGSSGSSIEESGSYDSEYSGSNSESETGSACKFDDNDHASLQIIQDAQHSSEPALVNVSDDGQGSLTSEKTLSTYISTDLAELMSKTALESWLDEQPGLASVQTSTSPSGTIAINHLNCSIVPKLHTLLDPASGNGLKVEYAFSSEISTASPVLVCIEVFLENLSSVPLINISLNDGEPNIWESPNQKLEEPESQLQADCIPSILSFEEIASLNPGQRVKKVVQVHFRHHLLPLKLFVYCNGKKISTKIWPDIGYFLKPLPMSMQAFIDKERQLPGMFEYSKRCTFKDHINNVDSEDNSIQSDKTIAISRSLAAKMLSNSNVYLVSADIPVSFNINDASGLCLRFSGEILSSSKPCLLTVTAEGNFFEPLDLTVKINCEETVFGLNLLNRVATFLQ